MKSEFLNNSTFPKVSIIILNWDGLNDTVECLESLRKIDYPNCEIIVVDNASVDGSPERIQSLFPDVTMVKNTTNLGFAGGNNIGMKLALENGAKYVWLLNNDTVVEPDTLSKLVAAAESRPEVGLLSPVIYSYGAPDKIQYCGSYFDWDNYAVKSLSDLSKVNLFNNRDSCLWGTALLIKREVIENVGYLNERYFAYWEDFEYSLRALRAGYLNRVDLSAKIFHKLRSFDKEESKKFSPYYFYYKTRNAFWLWIENIQGKQKAKFKRKYLVAVLRDTGFYKQMNDPKRIDALLDGIYCAFRNVEGSWDNRKSMTGILKSLILSRPYLLADIIEGDFRKILTRLFTKKGTRAHYVFLRKFAPTDSYGGCEGLLLNWLRKIDSSSYKASLVITSGRREIFHGKADSLKLPHNIIEHKFITKPDFFRQFFSTFFLLRRLKANRAIFVEGCFGNFSLAEILAGYLATEGNLFLVETQGLAELPEKVSRKYFGFLPGLGLWWHQYMWQQRQLGILPKKILAVSKEVKERLVDRLEFSGEKIVVQYTGITTGEFSPSNETRNRLRKEMGLPQDCRVIISTARLNKIKALHRLINAFDIASQKHPNLYLLFTGDGPLKDELRKSASQKSSAGRIIFLGFVDSVVDLLKISDIYVLPSLNEGLGIALVEAMASGLVVVATRTPGPAEIIKDGFNGFLVDNSEEGVIAGLLKALSLDAKQEEGLRLNARRFAVDNFDAEKNLSEELRVFGIQSPC
jgi:GT2 family glycosyltransferase